MKPVNQRELAQSTLAREVGYVVKPGGARLRVALAFPNTYYVGMSNLGFQTVYRLFNDLDEVMCERVFLPPKPLTQDMLARGTRLVTIESQTPLHEFDVLAFSVSFEWDYPNVVSMLRLAGLPHDAGQPYGSASPGRHRRCGHLREPRTARAVRRRHCCR